MSETTAAIHSNCAKCGEPIGDSCLLIGKSVYHHHCSPYQGAKFEASPPRGAENSAMTLPEAAGQRLWPFHGFAPGGYACICDTCELEFTADKRCITCAECAIKRAAEAELHRPQPYTGEVGEALLGAWRDAYAAFHGAFDTPASRRRQNDEYAIDARKRLHEFDETLTAAVSVPGK